MQGNHTLCFINRLELANFVGVVPPTCGALIVEVSSNVVPTKPANLLCNNSINVLETI